MLFADIGEEGQQRLLASTAVIVGCGAIGAAAANLLVRAGVGRVRIIDRDFVEQSNLQRQTLFDEAVASYGLTMTILPGVTPCLACLLETQRQGLEETCDTVGVLGSIVNLIASLEVADALKLLSGRAEQLHGRLISCDVWSGRFQSVRVARNPDCRVCVRREFSYLEGEAQPHITMCGRDSVQIHERGRALDLAALRTHLARTIADVRQNDFLLRFRIPPYEMTVFADGRAILKGTKDPAVARSVYARYIGA